jgi:YHS domain-containing protein
MSQAKDPVCGKVIDVSDAAARVTYESREVHFCSDECRRTFEADPERFEIERHEPPFTVKGGIAAPKFGAAASGGLEYEAAPERHGEEAAKRKK